MTEKKVKDKSKGMSKAMQRVITWLVTAIFAFLYIMLDRLSSESPQINFWVIFNYVAGYLSLVLVVSVVFAVRNHGRRTREAEDAKEHLMRTTGCTRLAVAAHISGLPITSGAACTIGIAPEYFMFIRDDNIINLSMDKVMDVKVETPISTGTVGGSTVKIKGRPQLSIVYMDNKEEKELLFSCPKAAEINRLAEHWRLMPRLPAVESL